jgi:UDP-N-acetylglucosamine diphosphorylase/glucosamine-1-phosphate N-acetyltransferase
MKTILFDPPLTWQNMLPLTFTRPVCEIRIGILTIREKWEKHLEEDPGWLTQSYLQIKFPFNPGDDNLFINGSMLPEEGLLQELKSLEQGQALVAGESLIGLRLGRKEAEQFDPGQQGAWERVEYSGPVLKIDYPWEIFAMNGQALKEDFRLMTEGRKSAALSSSNTVLGRAEVFLEESSRVECASLNTGNGPIYIGKGAEVMEGSHIRGPFALCDDSTIKMGAKIYGPTTIGPACKAGGEINNSVLFGYSNKGHDGFLGNSVIGEWCNIGADSNNSNLKNNYSEVRVWNYREAKFISTGRIFCGMVMADHSKCGINTMFNTGTVVGVNANIFGSGFPRNFVPSSSWGGAHGLSVYKLEKALEVASEVMQRRGIKLDSTDSSILSEVFNLTEKYRS